MLAMAGKSLCPRWQLKSSDLCLSTSDFGCDYQPEPNPAHYPVFELPQYRPEYVDSKFLTSSPTSSGSRYDVDNFENDDLNYTARLGHRFLESRPPAQNSALHLLALPKELRQRIVLMLVDDEQLLSTSLSSLHSLALEYAKIHPVVTQISNTFLVPGFGGRVG